MAAAAPQGGRVVKKETVSGKLPRLKVRMGVLPSRPHRDKTVYLRREKHPKRPERDAFFIDESGDAR